jgi:phosphatidyl-myo-inositol dimannoside synthase
LWDSVLSKIYFISKILFLTLKVFSATGGIEKVCRVAGKALYEYGLDKSIPIRILSMHDDNEAADDNQYFPSDIFSGFNAAKATFILHAVSEGVKSKVVILSHVNLLIAGWLIKKTSPSTTIILMAHGIEVWKPFTKRQLAMLKACDKIVSVSNFTKEKIQTLHHLPNEKCLVLNNCIDPFLLRPTTKTRSAELMKRYGITNNDIVLLTLTRLSFRDRYKGYDYVLTSLVKIVEKNKNVKYILAGGNEETEKIYIDDMIARLGLKAHVVITGFLAEEELPAHFELADIYVMPSVKEGFGIVFVEAMYYGTPVIAGNADGSTDALLQGKLGILIKPDDTLAITDALQKMITNKKDYKPNHELLMDNFGYESYKRKLEVVLER